MKRFFMMLATYFIVAGFYSCGTQPNVPIPMSPGITEKTSVDCIVVNSNTNYERLMLKVDNSLVWTNGTTNTFKIKTGEPLLLVLDAYKKIGSSSLETIYTKTYTFSSSYNYKIIITNTTLSINPY